MHRTPPRRVNGTRTTYIPMTPDSILLHHIIETQRWHTQEIARLSTQISTRRRNRRTIQELPPWVWWAWGTLMLLLAQFSPETVDRVDKLMAVLRGGL